MGRSVTPAVDEDQHRAPMRLSAGVTVQSRFDGCLPISRLLEVHQCEARGRWLNQGLFFFGLAASRMAEITKSVPWICAQAPVRCRSAGSESSSEGTRPIGLEYAHRKTTGSQ
jgi:hypothetical protein